MSSGVQSLAAGIVDGNQTPASAVVSVNQRVLTQSGPIGMLSDVVSFTGVTVAGNWVVGAIQTQVMAMPMITQTSTGIGYSSGGTSTGPMTVRIANTKVLAR